MGPNYSEVISYWLDFFTSSSLKAYTVAELMTRYGLKIGNRFPLMNDEVTGVFYICSAIRPVFVGRL